MTSAVIPASVAPGPDFETEFEETEYLEGIEHDGEPNRAIATSTKIGLRSFSVHTSVVQWGKYGGKDAVLLVFSLSFNYTPMSRERVTEAFINIEFEETADRNLTVPADKNIRNDPIVKRIGPVRWEGEGQRVQKAPIRWEFNPQITFGDFGVQIGSVASEINRTDREYSVKLIGNKTMSDSMHPDYNAATWRVYEDGSKRAGIIANFRVALVAVAPRNPPYPFLARINVNAKSSSKLFSRELRSTNDAPVFFDRKTSKPEGTPLSYGVASQDFADGSFPWGDLSLIPSTERIVEISED